jgi:outer membrane protein
MSARMTRGSTVVCALSALLCAGSAAAQQLPAVLTLEDAQRIAREFNPQYQRVSNDLDVAGTSVRSAWGQFMPSVSTSLGFSGGKSTAVTGQDDFGRPVELPEARSFRSSSASQSIRSDITLFDGGANLRNLRAQRALYDATSAQIDAEAARLDAQVARAYYQAVKAERDIALEEQLLTSARERLARTEELVRLAAVNRVDVLGAREEVIGYQQSLARVRTEADKARIGLATAIGIEPQRVMTLDTVLPAIFDPGDLNVEQLVARAVGGSPAVRQREAALHAAAQRRLAATARRLPTLTANASYGRSMSLSSYEAFGELNPQNSSFSFGMGVSLPLFTRFQTSAAVVETTAAQRDAEHDLRGARLAAAAEVHSAVLDLTNAYTTLQLAEERAELSRERLELALERYRLGGFSFTELQAVIDRTAQAERQALDARFSFVLARVALEERLGSRLES